MGSVASGPRQGRGKARCREPMGLKVTGAGGLRLVRLRALPSRERIIFAAASSARSPWQCPPDRLPLPPTVPADGLDATGQGHGQLLCRCDPLLHRNDTRIRSELSSCKQLCRSACIADQALLAAIVLRLSATRLAWQCLALSRGLSAALFCLSICCTLPPTPPPK